VLAVYNAVLIVLALLALPFALVWLAASRRARRGLRERLSAPPPAAGRTVWVHAASVGEAEAAAPLLSELAARGVPLLATTLTATGRARLSSRFPDLGVRLLPIDLPGLANRSVRRTRVAVLVLIETELWPNLIAATDRARGRVVMVGARVSDRAFRRYRLARPLFRPLLARMWWVGARSDEDRRRLIELGARPERTPVIGDLKLDRFPAPPPGPELRAALGPGPFLVGGSTHAGEEEALLESWRQLRRGAPGLRLLLAPRHPERVQQVVTTARRFGARIGLRSEGAGDAEVVILNTLGELGAVYHLADLVFCGGTLAPIGGHNLVEPVQAGRVVVHGPHFENQRTQEALLRPLRVLHAVENARGLSETLARLWSDPDRNAPALAAAPLLERHRGATERALELVLDAFEQRAA
jgi:3-deoxy-D-manno-octulosonic-acid transferase